MCGFAGVAGNPVPLPTEALAPLVRAMARRLERRGPDDEGVFVAEDARCAFGFRRLSILDLSPAGHQPMTSRDGRYEIVFNGEVYNHATLRDELARRGIALRGHSDTEVVLETFASLGPAAVSRLRGMFAIALWDRETRSLRLYRDHLGKKPLYYGSVGRTFAFASSLAPLHLVPGFERRVNRSALQGLLRYGCVPAPCSIFEDLHQLLPGHGALYDTSSGTLSVEAFFDPRALAASRGTFQGTTDDAVDAVSEAVREAVRRRLVADVPVGAFLSGGIDSSLVVGAMQSLSVKPIKTFTIGYDEHAYDEATHAERVASHLGTDHSALRVTPRDALAVVPELCHAYDEPFADSSQIPTMLVSQLARREVTVVLSGDGGDESFGGYNRYFEAPRLLRAARALPGPMRRTLMDALARVPASRLDALVGRAAPALPRDLARKLSGDRIQKAARALADAGSLDELYITLLSHHREPSRYVIGGTEPTTVAQAPPAWLDTLGPVERMMMLDTLAYLPNDILTKVDRATMYASLEARAPLLDLEVVELAWRLPLDLEIREGGKWILKRVLERYVPRALFDRPKTGFGVPIEHWLRSELAAWADDLLAPETLTREGYFDSVAVRSLWDEHQRGINHQHRLWPILMFQQWQRAWLR